MGRGKRFAWRAGRRDDRAAERAAPSSPGAAFADADDQAHYSCICGHAFKASVTASVRCPRCGTAQPW
jgi:hypothetical protein